MNCPECGSDKLIRSGWTKTDAEGTMTRGVTFGCTVCNLWFKPPTRDGDEEDIT